MQKGFGLLEVLVATGILGGLSLVLMKMNEEGARGVAKVEKTFDILSLDSEINNYLGNRTACAYSLNLVLAPFPIANITGTDPLGASTFKGPSIRNKDHNLVYNVSSPLQQR